MKRFYISFLRKNSFYFFFPFFLAALIFSIASTGVLAQGTPADFTTISWDTAASQPYPISEAQGRVVNGKLYSFGGFDSRKSTFTPTKRSYVYNPVANTWSAIADLPYTPNGANYGGVTHAGITTDGTDIYIAGGYTSDTSGTGQIFGTKQAWKYNVSQDSFTVLPDLPISVAAGQLEYLDGKLHYIGGTNLSRTLDLGNHYVLDLNNLLGGWSTLAPLPNPRHHAGSAVYGGKIYFIGGQHGHDEELVTQNDVHFYDPSNNTWTQVAALPVPSGANGRGHISSAVTVIGDRILLLGGEIVHNTSVNMVSAYSPANNSWENLTPLPENRFSGVAGVMNNMIYYTGGSRTKTTYKGTPEVVLSSQDPPTAAEDIYNLERNFKNPRVYPNPFQK
ncbi:MAG TPA: kelch repeat-containing protein, partial [Segetibacter sp.]|nr:kelch repeat-containing protein [Segetibacter sp.]